MSAGGTFWQGKHQLVAVCYDCQLITDIALYFKLKRRTHFKFFAKKETVLWGKGAS